MAQDIVVEVDTRDGQPVLVKTATSDEAVQRLAEETERLRQAQHPGVVELVETASEPAGRTVTAWAGGRTLETIHPPLAVAGALLASLASTVADLHDLGLVHGRIEGSHVVVAGDGRPRLCGFGPTPEPAVTAVDDVAGLGRLIDLLVGAEAEPEPIPDRRWGRRRWTGFTRRALQTLSDQASHPEPARRPTARNLARAIVEIMPEARLAPPAPASPFEASTIIPAEATAATEPATTTEPVTATEAVAARGSGSDPGPPEDPAIDAAPEADPDPHGQPAADTEEPAARPAGAGSATFLGLRVLAGAAAEEEEEEEADGRPDLTGDTDDGDSEPDGADHGGADRQKRPVPRRRSPSPRLRRQTTAGRAAAVAAAALVVVAAAIGLAARRDQNRASPVEAAVSAADRVGPPSTAPDRTAGSLSTGPMPAAPVTSPPAPPPADEAPEPDPSCPPAAAPSADVDGDGCPEAMTVEGSSVSAGSVRFRVGRDGDRVAVGDWDCDGQATPALVRPSTGEIFVFPRWATAGRDLTVAPTAVVAGVTAPTGEALGRCGPLRVRTADGDSTTVASSAGVGS